ncbi:MAG TPA: GDSL-type esterase/lipase family protein [Mucilaginibacter sp.]|nr:GDSL-type esterase/lipase family protein [Mucilaginibacter sp.]
MSEFRGQRYIFFVVLFLSALSLFAQSKKDLHIIYIGDSITQGVQLNDPTTQAPPAAANEYLQSTHGSGRMDFSNQGHSGYTTVDFLPGGETFKKLEQAANGLAGKPGVLVFSIMLGTNDSAITGPNGAPVSPDAYFSNLKTIIDRLLKDYPNCKVIIHHPIWYSPNTYNGSQYLQEGLDRLQSYFPEIAKLVSHYVQINKRRVFVGDTKAFDYFKKTHLTMLIPENGHRGVFYLHPNEAGAKELGIFWAKAIYKRMIANKKV